MHWHGLRQRASRSYSYLYSFEESRSDPLRGPLSGWLREALAAATTAANILDISVLFCTVWQGYLLACIRCLLPPRCELEALVVLKTGTREPAPV